MNVAENQSAVKKCASQLSTIGESVLQLLKTTHSGKVAARFSHCAYLEFNTEWVCLALSGLGAGPTVLQLNSAATELHAAVQVGTPVTFEAHRYIRIGDFTIDTHGAKAYSGLLTTQSAGRQCVSRWAAIFQANKMTVGLAPVLRHIEYSALNIRPWRSIVELSGSQYVYTQHEFVPADVQTSELLAYVAPAMMALLNWVHAVVALEAPIEPPLEITALLGAGPGLTPSGDDFLAGVLCALQLSGHQKAVRSLRSVLLPDAQQFTTPVSASLLKQAFDGRINEHAQQLVHCVLFSKDVNADGLQHQIQRMGASSGWDFLTGLVLGVLACHD